MAGSREAPKRTDNDGGGGDWRDRLVAGIIGSVVMISAGTNMASIRSEGERTIMETHHHSMVAGFIGLGILGMMLLWLLFGSGPRP